MICYSPRKIAGFSHYSALCRNRLPLSHVLGLPELAFRQSRPRPDSAPEANTYQASNLTPPLNATLHALSQSKKNFPNGRVFLWRRLQVFALFGISGCWMLEFVVLVGLPACDGIVAPITLAAEPKGWRLVGHDRKSAGDTGLNGNGRLFATAIVKTAFTDPGYYRRRRVENDITTSLFTPWSGIRSSNIVYLGWDDDDETFHYGILPRNILTNRSLSLFVFTVARSSAET